MFTNSGNTFSVRDNTRHVTVIPIDRRVYDGDFERVLNVQASQSNPFDVSIDNNEGTPAVVSGQQISNVSAGNRLQVPNIVNGPDTDTDGASKKHFKESKFSKMGGKTKFCNHYQAFIVKSIRFCNLQSMT